MNQPPDQFDSPWKEALELYLHSVLEFCFPEAAQAMDWEAGVEFLDKELQEIVRDADLGKQRVDKLIKVKLRDGTEEWVLVHVEVQHETDANLPLRVYQYHHRVRDRFGRRVATMVILADEHPAWRPDHYEEHLLGCRLRFDFPVCKLLDLVERAQAAAASGTPAGLVILANWAAQQTRGDMPERLSLKWTLTRQLYDAGLSRKDILELYRLIDWLLGLPEGLERDFRQRVATFEASKVMPYVTSIERLAKAEGRIEGRSEGWTEGRNEGRNEGRTEGRNEGRTEGEATVILRLARRRWGAIAATTEEQIRRLSAEQLENLAEVFLDLGSPAELDGWLVKK
jgi:predicted transposase YdaD